MGTEAYDERRLTWAAIVVAWLAISLIVASQSYLDSALGGRDDGFTDFLAWLLVSWAFWIPAAQAVLALGRRFPLERATWLRSSALHLVLALAFAIVHAPYFGAVSLWLSPYAELLGADWATASLAVLSWSLHAEVVIYWGVLGAGQALAHHHRARERERRAAHLQVQLSEARLAALESQLRPHFLFNSLNTIAMLVRQQDGERAVRMIAGLGDLLRATLGRRDTQEVPLGDELDFARRYLEIEAMRFAERLRLEIDVAPELHTLRVPNLILQPLVENAVRHGLSRSESASLIRIAAEESDGFLELTVLDDGPGPPSDWSLEADAGVGLENTRERLRELYGDAHQVWLGREQGGTVVRIRFPVEVRGKEKGPPGVAWDRG